MNWKMGSKFGYYLIRFIIIGTLVVLGILFQESRDHSSGDTGDTLIPLEETWYTVKYVVDGDTVGIENDGAEARIRLLGIDTPETVDSRTPVECFGRESSLKTADILSGEKIRLAFDPSQGIKDRYGRVLAYVYLENGELVNKTLIREGYAREYTYIAPHRMKKEFEEAERLAREEEKGLWSKGVCGGET